MINFVLCKVILVLQSFITKEYSLVPFSVEFEGIVDDDKSFRLSNHMSTDIFHSNLCLFIVTF